MTNQHRPLHDKDPAIQPTWIGETETERFCIIVFECNCGYHLGVDATFIDQVGPFETICPACNIRLSISESD